jgi:hypothetical protein
MKINLFVRPPLADEPVEFSLPGMWISVDKSLLFFICWYDIMKED